MIRACDLATPSTIALEKIPDSSADQMFEFFPLGWISTRRLLASEKKHSPAPLLMDQRVFVTRHRPKLERFQKRTTILKTADIHIYY